MSVGYLADRPKTCSTERCDWAAPKNAVSDGRKGPAAISLVKIVPSRQGVIQ